MNYLAQVNIAEEFGSPWGTQGGLHLGDLAGLILSTSLAIASVIVILLFIFGGLKIITSAGADNPRGTADGKQAMTWAAIGFIIIFGAYWIIRIIEIIIGVDFLTNPVSLFGYGG